MRHFAEDELIGYQMGEAAEREAIRLHLEGCAECAGVAESVAETLRVFSAEPLPEPNLEHAWQRMRGSLPVLAHVPAARPWWRGMRVWFVGSVLAAAALVGVAVHKRPAPRAVPAVAHMPPGPLTDAPVDPEVAGHLESAERLLTEVNHAVGPLDATTRTQAHELLLRNALYVRKAHDSGDTAEASVLEDLGRTLTTIDHEPIEPAKSYEVRLDMTARGLLLDIRILQQNDTRAERKE